MKRTEISENDIVSWISEVLKDQDFAQYEVTIIDSEVPVNLVYTQTTTVLPTFHEHDSSDSDVSNSETHSDSSDDDHKHSKNWRMRAKLMQKQRELAPGPKVPNVKPEANIQQLGDEVDSSDSDISDSDNNSDSSNEERKTHRKTRKNTTKGKPTNSGFTGLVMFAKISGLTSSGEEKQLNLVIKHSSTNEKLRRIFSLKTAYENEIYVYETLLPVFRELAKGACNLDMIPTCYKTISLPDREILVLESLKTKGYHLHNIKIPMNRDHTTLVLDAYAKFHAFSFVLKDKNPEKFQEVTNYFNNASKSFLECQGILTVLNNYQVCVETLKDAGEVELMEKVRSLEFKRILEMSNGNGKGNVILHGDCWNNNFLFRYKKNDREHPQKVSVIDWQFAKVGSPVFDLSYFLFCSISTAELHQIESLLEKYYTKLSKYISELGSDPQKLYTKDELMSDWLKFGKFGIIFAPTIHKMMQIDETEMPHVSKYLEFSDDVGKALNIDLLDPIIYQKKIVTLVQYMVDNGLL